MQNQVKDDARVLVIRASLKASRFVDMNELGWSDIYWDFAFYEVW